MRIISNRHDYYDIGLGLGHDDSTVYVREPKDIDLYAQRHHSNYYTTKKFRFENIYIGFCGKIYPVFLFHADKNEETITGICYTIEEVDKFVHTHLDKHDIEDYDAPERRFKRYRINYSPYWRPYWGRKGFIDSFEKLHEYTYPEYTKLFKEHNCPIFVIDQFKNKIHINCLLRPWEFYKVFDPYSAFQEISMYVGGVLLAPVKPVPNVSDETMRDIKGFDKYSFRKDKSND